MEENFNKSKNKILQTLTNHLNGTLYEIYIYNYLKSNNIECWLWNFVPIHILYKSKYINKNIYNKFINEEIILNPLPDKGIDLIAIYDLKYVFIQCKNYKGMFGNTSLNTYFNIMNKYPYNMGLIFYSNKICCNINKNLKNIEYIHMPFDNYKNHKSINKYTNKIQETIDEKILKYPSIIKLYKHKNQEKTLLIANYSLNKFIYNIQEIEEYINNYNKLPSIEDNENKYYLLNYCKNNVLNDDFNIIWSNFKNKYKHLL